MYPISCLSGVVQRVCWALIRMANLYFGRLEDSVDRLQVQSVGNVEEAPVSGSDMSEEPMESRVRSPTGSCRSMRLVPLMLVLELTLKET